MLGAFIGIISTCLEAMLSCSGIYCGWNGGL